MPSNRRDFIRNISTWSSCSNNNTFDCFCKEKNKISEVETTVPIKKVHMIFKRHLDVGFTSSARKITKNLWTG